MSVCTDRRAVKAGWIETSTRSYILGSMRKCSFCTTWMASKWVWCIFQFPLIRGLRTRSPGFLASGIGCLSERFDARKVALLYVLERGAAAGGHMVDLAIETELLEGRRAVAAAHDGEAPALGHRLCHRAGAGLEAGILEHAHGPIPEQ